MTARALSIRQPWAWAITDLDKRVENRTRKYAYRGELFLHASSWRGPGDPDGWSDHFLDLLGNGNGERFKFYLDMGRLPLGAIVGAADLVGCQEALFSRASGNDPVCTCVGAHAGVGSAWGRAQRRWAESRSYWLILDNVRKLAEPVPCRGMLGLWPVPVDVERRVREQLR